MPAAARKVSAAASDSDTLAARGGNGGIRSRSLISPVYTRYANLATTILAVSGEIHVHLRARCATAQEAETLVAQASAEIEPLLGDRVYSCNGDSLEKVIGDLLRARHASLSVAESATSGLLGGESRRCPRRPIISAADSSLTPIK